MPTGTLSAQLDGDSLLACARSLQRAVQAGLVQPLLRGKNLGLLCEDDCTPEAALFRHAGLELGAQVAHLRPSLSDLRSGGEISRTARMLGRLYDAVECQGLPNLLVRQLGIEAGIPVFDGLAMQQHALATLAPLVCNPDTPDGLEDNRRFVLQAVLLGALD